MNRCSFREWIPILPWPVWPLAGQCLLWQKTVVGSMTILLLAVRGNIARRSMSGPRFLYNFTTPRLGVELPPMWQQEFTWFFVLFHREFRQGNRLAFEVLMALAFA